MIRINDIVGSFLVFCFMLGAGVYGLRTFALMQPPSDVTLVITQSLQKHPSDWRLGGDDNILYNDKLGLEIHRFGPDGSVKVTRHGELVPTLDQSMNLMLANPNQNYLAVAMRDWMRVTAAEREARMVQQMQYEQS